MRKLRPLDALFPKTRQSILSAMLLHPARWRYQSDLAKHLGVPPSSLQRELAALSQAGVLRTRRDGNRVYFQPDPQCPFLYELTGLLIKTAGLVDVLRQALRKLAPWVRVSFVYGSVARDAAQSGSDVDLMVIGDATLAQLASSLRLAQQKLDRPVNPTVFTASELAKKLSAGNHFLETVLREPKLFVIGDEHELEAIAGKRPRPAARHKQGRAG
jgi:predicted nucleotidyltransferase